MAAKKFEFWGDAHHQDLQELHHVRGEPHGAVRIGLVVIVVSVSSTI